MLPSRIWYLMLFENVSSQINGVMSLCGSIFVDVMIQSEGAIEMTCALVPLYSAIRLDKLQLAFSMIISVAPKRGNNGPTRSAPLQSCALARRSIDKSACVGHVAHQYHARLPIVLLHHLHDQFWSTCGFTCVQLISLRLLRSIRMLRERHSWHSL